MAPPIHQQRMEMYHDMSAQPPPIPIKLKPKTLKKLSQQGRGPVYVIVPNPPHPPGVQGSGPSLQHPHQQNQRSSYNSNFTLMPRHHQHVPLVPMPPPLPPPPTAIANSSVASGQNGSINSGGSLLLDNHQRFRPDKPSSSRPRVQQLQQWMRHERNSANWIKHLTDDDDDDEETEDVVDHQHRRNGTSNSTNHQRPSSQVQLSSRVASMTIADVSPRFALKKILMLSENRQYRESANFINRLSGNTFGVIVHDLPVDLFIDSMPQSLPIIESLYAKVFLSDGILTRTSLQFLRPDAVVMQMVRFFAQHEVPGSNSAPTGAAMGPFHAPFGPLGAPRSWDYCGPFISSCKKLLRVIVLSEPSIRKGLQQKRRALDKAIEGLGQHGLVGTDEAGLMPLHDALQVEFRRVVHSYKTALTKLEELELAAHTSKKSLSSSLSSSSLTGRTVSSGPAPIAASHQRLLSLKQNEVQERLIKNKTLLNVVEPTLTNHSLDLFLGILQRRIELDKDVLFQFAQLKRQGSTSAASAAASAGSSSVSGSSSSSKSPDSASNTNPIAIAPLLMNFSHGCQQVLELMREVSTDQGRDAEEDATEDSSDVSGYHSDSDSAVMASGNSPFVSKSARYNFLSRSVRLGSRASIRTSLLVNSLGLETAGIKGQSRQQQQVHGQGLHQKQKPSSTATSATTTTQSRRITTMADCPSTTAETGASSSTSGASSTSAGDSEPSSCRSSPDPRSCQRCQQQTDLQMELESIKAEMKKANNTINALQEREKHMKIRLANQAQKMVERGVMGAVSLTTSEQRSALIRSYGNLYAQSRIETLECLDKLEGLRDADELKSKLLFSVVVLAFRSLQATSAQMKEHVRRVLQIPPNLMAMNSVSTTTNNINTSITTISLATTTGIPTPPPPPPSVLSATVKRPLPPPPPAKRSSSNNNTTKERYHPGLEVEHALASYLRQSVDSFDLTKNTEDVCNQIWATLFDYPCLQSCDGLVKYIKDSVRLAWSLVNQSPPFVLEYDTRHFVPELHVRFHTSNPNDDAIKTYLWPALVEGHNGPCLHKAVVIT